MPYRALRLSLFSFFVCLSFVLLSCYPQSKGGLKSENAESETSDSYSWHFGKVEKAETLKHGFVIKNTSQQILNIKGVNTSCGCTVSEVKKKTLSPGEDTLLEVRFNPQDYSGPTQQYIYVHTDDIDKPILKFTIKADVVKN